MDNLSCSNFENEAARKEAAPDILHRLYQMMIDRTQNASEWYLQHKDKDRKVSQRLRFGAIVFSTLALLVPILIATGLDTVQTTASEQVRVAARQAADAAVRQLMVEGALNADSQADAEDATAAPDAAPPDPASPNPESPNTASPDTEQNDTARSASSEPMVLAEDDAGWFESMMRWFANLSQAWALFFAAIAAGLIGIDRLMGYSTGWVRNVRAGLDLQHRREQFVLEWWALQTYYPLGGSSSEADPSEDAGDSFMAFAEGMPDSPPTGPPTPLPEDQDDDYVRVLEKYVDALWAFDQDVRKIMEEETEQWIQEFQSNLQALRSRISSQTSRTDAPTSTLNSKDKSSANS